MQLVRVLGFLFNVLVQEGTPVGNEKAMWVVLSPWNTLQLTCGDKLAHEDACTSLYTLTSIVRELHVVLVKLDAVTEDAEYGTCTHDIRVKAFLLEVSA